MEVRYITPSYFEVMGIPMRRGRALPREAKIAPVNAAHVPTRNACGAPQRIASMDPDFTWSADVRAGRPSTLDVIIETCPPIATAFNR
jgi:hypothetical protein